jgi:hypothetical protein
VDLVSPLLVVSLIIVQIIWVYSIGKYHLINTFDEPGDDKPHFHKMPRLVVDANPGSYFWNEFGGREKTKK